MTRVFAFAVNWARLAILGPISQIEEFRFWKMAIGLLASLERTQGLRKRSEGGELDQWKCRCELSVGLVESRFKIYSRKRIAPVAAINGDLIEASFNPSFSLGIE